MSPRASEAADRGSFLAREASGNGTKEGGDVENLVVERRVLGNRGVTGQAELDKTIEVGLTKLVEGSGEFCLG